VRTGNFFRLKEIAHAKAIIVNQPSRLMNLDSIYFFKTFWETSL
jgi:hypothetical protein